MWTASEGWRRTRVAMRGRGPWRWDVGDNRMFVYELGGRGTIRMRRIKASRGGSTRIGKAGSNLSSQDRTIVVGEEEGVHCSLTKTLLWVQVPKFLTNYSAEERKRERRTRSKDKGRRAWSDEGESWGTLMGRPDNGLRFSRQNTTERVILYKETRFKRSPHGR
jgi:hypothetical protein